MAKQTTTENAKFRGNCSNQSRLGEFTGVDASAPVLMETRFLSIFNQSDAGMSSSTHPRSTDYSLSQQMAQILLARPDDVTLVPSIADAIRKTFDVDCCLIAIGRNSQGATGSTIDWYVSISSQMKQLMGAKANSLPPAADLQPLWSAMVAEPERCLKTQPEVVFSELESSCWLSQLSGSLIAIAVGPTGQAIGGLVLITMQPLSWKKSKMQQIEEVSNQVAIAISNVQQQRKINSYKQKVDSIRLQQDLIHQVTMAIHQWSDLNQTLQMAIDKLVDSLHFEQGLILLLKYQDPLYKSRTLGQADNHRGNRQRIPRAKVTVVCQSNQSNLGNLAVSQPIAGDDTTPLFEHPSLVNESFWLSDCPWCKQAFIQAPEPLDLSAARNLSPNKDATSGMFEMFQTAQIGSGINVPIVAVGSGGGGDTILGFLLLQDSSARHWSSEELKMLELVAIQLGNAILQNQTLHQVQALVEDRNAQLKRSMEVQAKLYELTRQQVEQLRRLNDVKDEFLDTLNHELKTPLATMRMAIENLRRPDISPERQAMYLDMMQAQLNRETKLVNDLLKLRELELRSSNIQLEILDLKPFLANLAENFQQTWSERELTLCLKLPRKSLKIQTDPKHLEHAIVELLTNAGKYSDPSTRVELQVMQQRETTAVTIALTNIGAGIFPEDIPHIFEKFRRGQGMTQKAVAGTGLGLALVKSLIEHLNGTIAVTSSPLQPTENSQDDSVPWQTCFTVTLPQQPKVPTL